MISSLNIEFNENPIVNSSRISPPLLTDSNHVQSSPGSAPNGAGLLQALLSVGIVTLEYVA